MARPLLLLCTFFLLAGARAQSFLPPEPLGGMNAVRWLMDQEMIFPQEALDANTEGEVGLRFLVMADGTIRDLHVTGSLRPDCDREAMRVARMIRWHPASVGGSFMDKEHDLSLAFSAKKYRKLHGKQEDCPRQGQGTTDASERVYKNTEVDTLAAPLIPRGLNGLPTYLAENLRYPPEAYRRDIQGKVTIEFIVEPSGSLSNLRATEALGGGCDDEAMRLARTMCWQPAVVKGMHVRSAMKLAIQFRLDPSQRP
ncbi:MAG TPA: energy transducer TonB [Flavobacteriales bacterium]|nr:energy transducer TonB [Flavobacteriales bacterium]